MIITGNRCAGHRLPYLFDAEPNSALMAKRLTTKTTIIMKEFFDIMLQDLKKEGFTKKEVLIYGVVVPLAFILTFGVAGWIEQVLAEL